MPTYQYRATPQAGHDQWAPPTMGVEQNGQTSSLAGGTAANFFFNDGSLSVSNKRKSSNTAATGAANRKIQLPTTKSGITGAAQNRTATRTKTMRPTHLKDRRVRGKT
jgi:hypothetical protein